MYRLFRIVILYCILSVFNAVYILQVNGQDSDGNFLSKVLLDKKIGLDVPRLSIYGGLGPGSYDVKSEEISRVDYDQTMIYQIGMRYGRPFLVSKRLFLIDISYKSISLKPVEFDPSIEYLPDVKIDEFSVNLGITFLNIGENSYFYILAGTFWLFIPDYTMDQEGESYVGLTSTLGTSINIFGNFSLFIEGGVDATITGKKYMAGVGEYAKSSGGIFFLNAGVIFDIPFFRK